MPASTSIAKSRSRPISRRRWRSLKLANAKGVKHGTVQDKLFLPGLKKLAFLRDSGFFGRMLSVRGEFGYWVFEGDWQEAQRPSWNYRSEDGGGIILDMVCHWRYVLDNLFGEVESVELPRHHRYSRALRREGQEVQGDRRRFRLRHLPPQGRRDRPHQHVLGDAGLSRRSRHLPGRRHATARRWPGLTDCVIQARQATPRPVWNPDEKRTHDFYADWQKVPENTSSTTTASRSSGRCSSATSARTRPTNTRCWKAPRACSLPNARCRAGASGAGSTSPRSRCEEAAP